MNRKFAFMASLDFADMSAEAVCETLADIGYAGIEWTLRHFNPRKHAPKDLKELVRITRSHGLDVSELVVQQDLVMKDEDARRDRIRFVMECIQAASEAGITTLNVFTGPVPWIAGTPQVGVDISEGEAWDMVFQAYEAFVREAEKERVSLAVEGVWGMVCRDFYTTRVLIEEFDSPNLGVNFDPSHDVLAGNLDVGWIFTQWDRKHRIKHVHLKDAVGVQELGKHLFPLLGEGNVDWKSFISCLDASSYAGFMSVEFESFAYYRRILGGDPARAASISMEQIRTLFG